MAGKSDFQKMIDAIDVEIAGYNKQIDDAMMTRKRLEHSEKERKKKADKKKASKAV